MNSSLSSRNFLTAFSSWLNVSKLASLISLVVALVLLPGLADRPKFHPDELKWSEASIFTFTSFLNGSETPDVWKQSLDTYGVQNPLLGKLLIGASLYVGGYRTFSGMPEWNWKRNVEWHRVRGRLPEARKLFYARLPVLLASACCLGMIAYLAGLGAGYLDGTEPRRSACLLVVVIALTHPLFLTYSRRVGLDIFALLFTTATVICVVHSALSRANTRCPQGFQWRSFTWFIAACFAGSLALNAKLNGALAIVFVGASRVLLLCCDDTKTSYRNRVREFAYGLMTLLVTVMVVTYLMTPLARTEPIKVIEEWNNLNSIVQDVYTKWFPNRTIYTLNDRLAGFAKHALSVNSFPYYLGSCLGFISLLIFLSTLLRAAKDDRARYIAQILGLWLIITAAALLKWVPLERPRYYLPFFPLLIMSASYSCILLYTTLLGWICKRGRPQSP